MTRLRRLTGDARLIGLQAEQSGQQSNRFFLDVRWQPLKVRVAQRRMKQSRLRDSWSTSGPSHQHLLP
jgi:hypothetical protein